VAQDDTNDSGGVETEIQEYIKTTEQSRSNEKKNNKRKGARKTLLENKRSNPHVGVTRPQEHLLLAGRSGVEMRTLLLVVQNV
jgi:hypothetical protein